MTSNQCHIINVYSASNGPALANVMSTIQWSYSIIEKLPANLAIVFNEANCEINKLGTELTANSKKWRNRNEKWNMANKAAGGVTASWRSEMTIINHQWNDRETISNGPSDGVTSAAAAWRSQAWRKPANAIKAARLKAHNGANQSEILQPMAYQPGQ